MLDPISASIIPGPKSRETISVLRKDVTAKCYDGDVTRKRKLPGRKRGTKRMGQFGQVDIMRVAFSEALKMGTDQFSSCWKTTVPATRPIFQMIPS